MLLTHYLAEVDERRLVLHEPEVSEIYKAQNESRHEDCIRLPVTHHPSLLHDFLLSFKVQLSNRSAGRIGMSWGNTIGGNEMNIITITPDTGIWQVARVMQERSLVLFEKRGRVSMDEIDTIRLSLLKLSGTYYVYVQAMDQPVFQCPVAELPICGNELSYYVEGENVSLIQDLRLWQLETTPFQYMSIEELLKD